MRAMSYRVVSVFIFLFASCTPSSNQIANSVQETLNSLPTGTPYPTYTIFPTFTTIPTSTVTLRPSNTPTKTKTSTPRVTKTSTPEAMTKTAIAVEAKQSQIAWFATSTSFYKIQGYTATASYKSQLSTLIPQYKDINWRELQSYANNHIGEKVVTRGRVFNVPGGKDLQLYFAGTYEAFYVTTKESFQGIYEDYSLTIYGEVAGEKCFKNIYDAEICQPYLKDAFFVR